MLVSWPFALKDMESAGGDGGSDWPSGSGSPPMAWECRLSLVSSWDCSWYLWEAAEVSLGASKGAPVWRVGGSEAGPGEQAGTPKEGPTRW